MKYRKKPVVIEAIQFTGLNFDELEEFVGGDMGKDAEGHTVIATLEGAMRVSVKDFVIKGVKGEFYPCKPDIFDATYEPVNDALSDKRDPKQDYGTGSLMSLRLQLTEAQKEIERLRDVAAAAEAGLYCYELFAIEIPVAFDKLKAALDNLKDDK